MYIHRIFPKSFKEAIMVLIHKGERDTTNISNYKPISLLENVEKILERIINERLQRNLEDNLDSRSELISQIQASRKIINVVTRDVSKAFDKVWQEGLRYKI